MNILSLETSTENCSVALATGPDSIIVEESSSNRHSDVILPLIDRLLKKAKLSIRDLDAIAFGSGPGAFSGIRMGCGVAQGIAFAHDLPVMPICSLEIIASQIGEERVLVCTDARMNEVYCAAYDFSRGNKSEVVGPVVCSPEDIPEINGKGWIGCGSGFDRYSVVLSSLLGSVLSDIKYKIVPSAKTLAIVGSKNFLSQKYVKPEYARPLYIRERVALKLDEQK